jgi:hypothetical protein
MTMMKILTTDFGMMMTMMNRCGQSPGYAKTSISPLWLFGIVRRRKTLSLSSASLTQKKTKK